MLPGNKIHFRVLLHDAGNYADANQISEQQNVNSESSELSQPGMAERAIDTATDVSRTITEVSAALQAAVDRLGEAIATARQPGKPLSTISAITREAPLASLFVAFLFGLAVARRR
jgi:thiamine biosynthesis lipoprotein ApbE